MINYISAAAMPLIILGIVIYGVTEKNKVYDSFIQGATEGIKIVFQLLPTLIGIFVAVGALRSSGILDTIIRFISPVTELLKFPKEILPLTLLRPISGSASMAVATDIMKTYGVDSFIGMITSTIMGSTETTFYTIAVYTSCVKIKKTRFVLIAALLADFARNVNFCHNMEYIVLIIFLTNKKHGIYNRYSVFSIYFIYSNDFIFVEGK